MLNEFNYCKHDPQLTPSGFEPKSKEWNSMALLEGLTKSDIRLNDQALAEKKDFFLHATYTEYDAENFCRHLEKMNFPLSPEFRAFEAVWRRDEWNHYIGFRYIYSIMYNEKIQNVAKQIEERPSDFSSLDEYFQDEFFICVLLAFDEILTTKGYGSEQNLYKSLGSPRLSEWFKQVTRDEAYHFNNVMEVIQLRHADRIPELPETLETLLKWDLQRNEYLGTFVLDHDLYSESFLKEGVEIINNYFT